jgi:hypothetical protein
MVRFLAVAISSIILAGLAGVHALEIWGGRFVPTSVLALNERAIGALLTQTEQAWQKEDKRDFTRIAKANSLSVLEQEPLSSRALRQLGIYYSVTGDQSTAQELIALSTKLTRRDGVGQLWLAENYARTGRLDESLRAFDVLIRTHPDAREVAYRALGAALVDPDFQARFVKLARQNPPWLPSFLAFNVGESSQPSSVAAVVRALQPLPTGTLPAAETGTLLSRLVVLAPIQDARALYLSLPNARPSVLTSLSFASPKEAFLYPPFGWELFDHTGVQAFGGNDGKSASIEAVVMPGYRGVAARKLLFLPAGSYSWSGTADLSQMAPGAAARMVLSCYSKPGEWTRSGEFPLRTGANRFAIPIPGKCPAQLLSLELVGPDSQLDSAMTLGAMSLSRGATN